MSDDPIPKNKWDRLSYAIGNVWDKWGRTDSLTAAMVINSAMLVAGVALWYYTSGILSFIGVAWAILHVVPIVKGVLNG